MANVPDRDVVVLAPEKRHRVEPLAAAEHVRAATCPWRSATTQCSTRSVRPYERRATGRHRRRQRCRRARLQVLVHCDAAVIASPACSAIATAGLTPTPTTRKSLSSVAPPLASPSARQSASPSDRGGRSRLAPRAAIGRTAPPRPPSPARAARSLVRPRRRRSAGPQRRRHLETDEARTNYDDMPGRCAR